MSSKQTPIPLVGVSACRKMLAPHPFHVAQEKYCAAVSAAAGAIPVIVPALGEALPADALLARLDGLLLSGSPSNVEPHHYGAALAHPDIARDPHRDATVLRLIRHAVDLGVPLFALCRGFQEMNVAYGGTLHQQVHAVDGLMHHAEDATLPLEEQYAPAHTVALEPDGLIARLTSERSIEVNSLHSQAIDRLGQGLQVEARAPDGLIEAFRVEGAATFALGVQWHPEWQPLASPVSSALFRAFGDACRERARRRGGPGALPAAAPTALHAGS